MMYEIDTTKILNRLVRFFWLIVLVFAVGMSGGVLYATHFKTDTYTAQTRMLIRRASEDSRDYDSTEELVETCFALLRSDAVIEEALEKTGTDYSLKQIGAMMKLSRENETPVFTLSITCPNPEDARDLAHAFATYGAAIVVETMDVSCVLVEVDEAKLPVEADPKNAIKTGVITGLLAALISAGLILMIALFDTHIKSESDLDAVRGEVPLIGVIPSFRQNGTGGYREEGFLRRKQQ